jgi:hypothetical protein
MERSDFYTCISCRSLVEKVNESAHSDFHAKHAKAQSNLEERIRLLEEAIAELGSSGDNGSCSTSDLVSRDGITRVSGVEYKYS